MRKRNLLLLCVFLLTCQKKKMDSPPPSSSLYADFLVEVVDECFILRLTDSARIAEARALLAPDAMPKIPIGRLRRGDGGFNRCGEYAWNWHMDPDSVHFAEMTIELCDGRPSFVEEALNYWVDTVKTYCPWAARLRAEVRQ